MTYTYPDYIIKECTLTDDEGLVNTCLGSSGRIGLWIAFGCMFIPMLIFWFKAASKPPGQRKFEYLSMAINGIASLAYLTMATGYGATIINKQEFFFARYIDWTLTTPLMLIDLILLAHGGKAKMETILHIVAVDMLMVVGGLIGALQGGHDSSWVFFAFSMFMFCPIFFYLLFDGSFKADIDPRYAGVYTQAAWLTAIFWCGYPIAWVLHEGTSTISLNSAVIVYLILDTICKSVWGFLITMGRDSVGEDPETMGINSEMGGAVTNGGSV
jgi:bacteriorhodopsin